MDRKRLLLLFLSVLLFSLSSIAQQQLGGLQGTVSDSTGAVVARGSIELVNNDTGLKKTAESRSDGTFLFPDLPIGTYTLTFSQKGFKKEVHDRVLVDANRTFTVNVKLQPGGSDTTVEVSATPLLNTVDTTNGYVLHSQQIEETPLATGSFTQLAVLSPGVSADFIGGTGTTTGLGNQSIWANGQRDTSKYLHHQFGGRQQYLQWKIIQPSRRQPECSEYGRKLSEQRSHDSDQYVRLRRHRSGASLAARNH